MEENSLNAGIQFNKTSCKPDCRFNGNCCSDYNICEIIQSDLKNNENCLIDNCKYCTEKTCMQCNENYYFYNNKCYLNCSSLQLKIEESKICLKSNNTLVIKNVVYTIVKNVKMISAKNV